MKRILITGATGNIGAATIRHLYRINTSCQLLTGVRDMEQARMAFNAYPQLSYVTFDFANAATFQEALKGIDILFLLRPPQLANVKQYFEPLLQAAREQGVQRIAFLSVQGAEKSPLIPHHKIEKLILQGGFRYIFIRPSYFMQNLSTTLLKDVRQQQIFLPAGNALFNWVDVENIGEAAAILLENFDRYSQQAYEITGPENVSFPELVHRMSRLLNRPIRYKSPGLLKFFWQKKRAGMQTPMILVMIMLHYLPRFGAAPAISQQYYKLSGKGPTTLEEFIIRKRDRLTP